MKTPQRFEFEDGYVLRSATDADEDLAREWTQLDPHHAGLIPGTFWTEQQNISADTYVLEDPQGTVLFVRLERVTRMLVQFPPMRNISVRKRAIDAMKDGIDWLVAALGVNRQRELIFDTKSERLADFAKSSLGFSDYPGVLKRAVPLYTPTEPQTRQAPYGLAETDNENHIQPARESSPIPGINEETGHRVRTNGRSDTASAEPD